MGVVVLGVSVSVEELRLALMSAGLGDTTCVGREGDLSVATLELDQPDLYHVFSRFRETNIWPALLAEGKYRYCSGNEWLNINEIIVTL